LPNDARTENDGENALRFIAGASFIDRGSQLPNDARTENDGENALRFIAGASFIDRGSQLPNDARTDKMPAYIDEFIACNTGKK